MSDLKSDLISREAAIAYHRGQVSELKELADRCTAKGDDSAASLFLHSAIAHSGSAIYISSLPAVHIHTTDAAHAVKVKPLEWLGTDPDYATSYCCLGSYTTINTYHGRGFMLQVAGSNSAIYLPSLEAAKAAAHADYEDRILAAIEVTP